MPKDFILNWVPDEVGEGGGDAEGVAQREPEVPGVHGAVEAVVLQDGDEGDASDHSDTDHLKGKTRKDRL